MSEFGERILYLKPKSKGKDKYESRWKEGVWVGAEDQSNEYRVVDGKEVYRVSRIQRLATFEDRWGTNLQQLVNVLPWDKKTDKDETKSVKLDIEIDEDKIHVKPEQEVKDKMIRQFRIEKTDLKKYGYTKGCAGCIHVAKKGLTGIQGHRGIM